MNASYSTDNVSASCMGPITESSPPHSAPPATEKTDDRATGPSTETVEPTKSKSPKLTMESAVISDMT